MRAGSELSGGLGATWENEKIRHRSKNNFGESLNYSVFKMRPFFWFASLGKCACTSFGIRPLCVGVPDAIWATMQP